MVEYLEDLPKTGTGKIACDVPEGVAVHLDVNTGMGTVDNRLSMSDSKPDASSYISIHARSGVGSIVLDRTSMPTAAAH